jgi:cysteinyl-tRNA synthetase
MAGLELYNALTKRIEPVVPINPAEVGIYTCGPTVYDYATIGNMRAYIFADVLRRTLELHGYRVKHVMNITDVGHLESDADEGEDKMVLGMRRERKTPWEIADLYTKVFFEHAAKLNILRPHVVARATEHIPEMIEFILRLERLGFTYEISDGVYFDISRFPAYGSLSRLDLDGQIAGARVEVNPEKRHPADFALWRKATPEHIMQWDSPWGRGYPGWHIECSAMSTKYLGDRFDIHTGGIDHIPVHHEDEIAQNDAAFGHQVVQRWMHNEFIQVDGGRMGKSLGNFYTVADLEDRGHEPLAYRYFVLNAHYRSKVNFTWEALAGAGRALVRLWQRIYELGQLAGATATAAPAAAADLPPVDETPQVLAFSDAVGNDLGTPQAMALLSEVLRQDGPPAVTLAILLEMDRVLGLSFDRAVRGEAGRRQVAAAAIPAGVAALLAERERARAARDWSQADALRLRMAELGYTIEDTPAGPKLKPR